MKTKIYNELGGVHPSADKVFYIFCADRFYAEILASCLERVTGENCLIYQDIDHIAPNLNARCDDRQLLILWDCKGKDVERLFWELKPITRELLSRTYFAFYNVEPGLGIEEKYVWRGLRGFFYRNDPLDRVLKGIETILKGELWLSREIMTKCILEGRSQDDASQNGNPALTSRQVQIIAMITVGATNDEIADKLCISPLTVKSHLHNIFRKIHVPNRLQAALWAAKNMNIAMLNNLDIHLHNK